MEAWSSYTDASVGWRVENRDESEGEKFKITR